MDWQKQIKKMRENFMKENFQACRDFGVPAKRYSDKTANSLTNAICDFLKFNNHYSNRINSTGIMRKVNGQMKWTKGQTNLGTADIACIINGRAVSIEIKIGADKMSEAQHKEKARIEGAGGVYVVAKDMEGFLTWYNQFTTPLNNRKFTENGAI